MHRPEKQQHKNFTLLCSVKFLSDCRQRAHLTRYNLLFSCWSIFRDKHTVGHVSELRRSGACEDGNGGIGAFVAVLIGGFHSNHVLFVPRQRQASRHDNASILIYLESLFTTYQYMHKAGLKNAPQQEYLHLHYFKVSYPQIIYLRPCMHFFFPLQLCTLSFTHTMLC